jgi:hypothetical protein
MISCFRVKVLGDLNLVLINLVVYKILYYFFCKPYSRHIFLAIDMYFDGDARSAGSDGSTRERGGAREGRAGVRLPL